MTNHHEEKEFTHRIQRVETLLQEVEQLPNAVRAATREIVGALLEMHGVGMERILERLADAGPTGLAVIDDLAGDDLVASLFLLYGLHPLDLETRVRQALDKVRPALGSHGGSVELVGVVEGVVHLRMLGSCNGCPSSALTLQQTIEQAIYEKAPDVVGIEVEEEAGEPSVEIIPRRTALPLV